VGAESVPKLGIARRILPLTITAGIDLSGGGVVALGGSTTLNLNLPSTDARYAQLNAAPAIRRCVSVSRRRLYSLRKSFCCACARSIPRAMSFLKADASE